MSVNLKELPFHDSHISNESWHPSDMDIQDMGEDIFKEAMAEWQAQEDKVLFKNLRVSHETCDCGNGYGCRHGSYPYKVINEFEGVEMLWEDDGFYIESPRGFIRFDRTSEMTMRDFVDACNLLKLQLEFL